ncbi:hypothetical protein AAW26_06005 [Vibrio alginolyticus]|nr:hypothetical protein AAW26_06005 [Vibrio alginolyticus]
MSLLGGEEAKAKECPDNGNCICIRYTVKGGTLKMGFTHFEMNLDDGNKTNAMYDLFKTA